MSREQTEQIDGSELNQNRRGPLIVAMLVVALVFAGVAAFSLQMIARTGASSARQALTPDPNMDMLRLPSFTLTTHDEETITRADLLNQITIVDFFFTNCPFICPTLNRNMKRAQEALEGSGVRFLSISVDPEHDTPERLQAHAEELGADLDTWTFATGPQKEVQRILTDGLLLAELRPVEDQPIDLDDGSRMYNISHPSRFVLVGPDAGVIALYDGMNETQVDRLVERAREATEAWDPPGD